MATLPVSGTCPRCRLQANVTDKAPICWRCQKAIRQQCRQEQERDYLAAYLSTRADVNGEPIGDSALTVYASDRREIARLVAKARALGISWTSSPAPIRFDDRMAAAMAPYLAYQGTLNKRGRPARRENVPMSTQAPGSNLAAS